MGKSKRNRESTAAESQSAAAPGKKKAPIMPVTIGIAVLLIAIVAFAQASNNRPTLVDGQVSRVIANVDECASTTVALELPADVDTVAAAEAIFDALNGLEGVGRVTVYEENPRAEINYCQSYTGEAQLQATLAPTGYVTP